MHWETRNSCDSLYCNIHKTGTKSIIFLRLAVEECWRFHLFERKHNHIKINQQKTGKRQWHPTPVLMPGKSHGQGSLVGCSPWSLEESDTTEQLHFHFSLSCTEEGNGNPLQCSCLNKNRQENPRDGGAWWAAVYGVAQSQTWLKRLSSSRSSSSFCIESKEEHWKETCTK